MSSKGKLRANQVQDQDEDAYGSDDPSHDDQLDESVTAQGSPKGYKRSRLNSAGDGLPVTVKAEKVKTPFEPLIRDIDGCAITLSFFSNFAHLF